MITEGDIVVFEFPRTDLGSGKLRPALLIKKVPSYDDWLVCMISTQLHQQIAGLEYILRDADENFAQTGLKKSSLFRVSRLAVVEKTVFEGKLGGLDEALFARIRMGLAQWINEGLSQYPAGTTVIP